MSEERFDRIDRGIAELKTDVVGLQSLPGQMEELRRHMHVLHEDMLANFAAASERNVVTRGEFQATLAERDERINRRLDPIEMVVRQHSLDIAGLKRTRK